MSGDASSALLTVAKWALDSELWLSDFVTRAALPHLALVTKGQHLSLGAPKRSSPSLVPYVLLHSTHRLHKLKAQAVRLKDGGKTRKILADHKLAIPESYPGYFEILSEDGKPVKCLESVIELYRAFPELCLVRTSVKAYVPDGDGELRSLFRTRTLPEGELLTLVGQFNFKKVLFLRCFDEQGGSVYLKLGQKARFSPVARADSLSGVHSAANLMGKRLPLTVKLIHGAGVPPELEKLQSAGALAFQLTGVFAEELVFAESISRSASTFLLLPLNAHLKLAPARNHPTVRSTAEFQRLCAHCEENLNPLVNSMQPFNELAATPVERPESGSPSDDPPADPHSNPLEALDKPDEEPPVSDREIEQLYDYIRGLAPLPDSCHESRGSHMGGSRPPPPPLNTIPVRPVLSPASSSTPTPRSTSERSRRQQRSPFPSPAYQQTAFPSSERQRRLSKSTEKMGLLVSAAPPPRAPLRRHSEKKRRPLSMVIPDPAHHRVMPQYFQGGAGGGMYQSFGNLSLTEDAAAYVQMSGGGGYFGAPPRFPPMGPPPVAVFPRFAPRYAFHPPYRLA